jgi:bile acid-coenzyme A ligase
MTPLSISRAISGKAEADPDRPCITFEGRTVTRRAFDRATNRLARAYARRGVTKGDLVTIALPNSIAFYEAAVAAWKLGATPQPVSWRLPLRERQAIVQLGNPRLIVGADPADHPDHAVLPPGFVPDAALDDGMLPDVIAPCWKAPTSGGSTGRPKLILAGRPGVVSGKAGLLAKFDAERTLQAVARHRATFLLLVPTMMLRIWRLSPDVRQRHDLSSLRAVQHLAAPCPAWLKEAWIDWLGPERIFELYAGVEAQAVCEIRGDDWLAHRGSVGRVLMGELRVVDADGTDVAPGQVGEIYMRNSAAGNASYTYVGAEARRLAGNWESIGDIGWMDEDGYVYLTDRRSDMVLVGGSNVYPAEVENAIQEHDAVLSCAVIGLPDEDMGNRLHAIVQTARPIAAADLDGFLSDRLVRYKQPRSYEFVDWPVRDDAGKVRRAALTQERAATMAVQA